MNAFLTGSHVYGKPHKDSDVDLVIRCSSEDAIALIALSDNKTVPCKFGKLNVIICETDHDFAGWLLSKRLCEMEANLNGEPLDKEEIIKLHTRVRNSAYLQYGGNSGQGAIDDLSS